MCTLARARGGPPIFPSSSPGLSAPAALGESEPRARSALPATSAACVIDACARPTPARGPGARAPSTSQPFSQCSACAASQHGPQVHAPRRREPRRGGPPLLPRRLDAVDRRSRQVFSADATFGRTRGSWPVVRARAPRVPAGPRGRGGVLRRPWKSDCERRGLCLSLGGGAGESWTFEKGCVLASRPEKACRSAARHRAVRVRGRAHYLPLGARPSPSMSMMAPPKDARGARRAF